MAGSALSDGLGAAGHIVNAVVGDLSDAASKIMNSAEKNIQKVVDGVKKSAGK